MESMYCEKHLALAEYLKKLADMGVIIDFPLCKDCHELQLKNWPTCGNENDEDCSC